MAPQQNAGAGAEAELPDYTGHYRLESCLGSGGMGVVHLARSTSGMKLAVKVVHAEFAGDPEFRGRFRQEVAAARRVSGAFTASVVDADLDAERPWMATLFIPGPTLADQVKRNGPMDPAELRRLMAGLAEALRDIHRVGVVHRDLKPSNVLLAEDGPKVIDFGISRPKDSELRTETGKLIGTPPFMAPEQFRRPREVGPAADVFALGSVMVHAATGRGPFDSDSPYVVAYQVVHDEPDLTGVPEEPRAAGDALPRQGPGGPAHSGRIDAATEDGGGLVRHAGVHTGAAGLRRTAAGVPRRPAARTAVRGEAARRDRTGPRRVPAPGGSGAAGRAVLAAERSPGREGTGGAGTTQAGGGRGRRAGRRPLRRRARAARSSGTAPRPGWARERGRCALPSPALADWSVRPVKEATAVAGGAAASQWSTARGAGLCPVRQVFALDPSDGACCGGGRVAEGEPEPRGAGARGWARAGGR